MARTRLQALINATARDGRVRFVPHLEVDASGPISVPVHVYVEGDARGILVRPDPPVRP